MGCATLTALLVFILIMLIYLVLLHTDGEQFVIGDFDHSLRAPGPTLQNMSKSFEKGLGKIVTVTDGKQKMDVFMYPTHKIPTDVLIADVQGKVI